MANSLGENISILRKKSNLSQKELAQRLNVSFQAVSKWETNASEPDIRTLRELCSIFNVSLDELLTVTNGNTLDAPEKDNHAASISTTNEGVTPVGCCTSCGRFINSNEASYTVSGNKLLCQTCYDAYQKNAEALEAHQKQQKQNKKDELNKKIKKMNRMRNIGFIIGTISLILFVVIGIILYTSKSIEPDGKPIALAVSLILAVGSFSLIELLFIKRGGWFIDLVGDALALNIRWPGIIFTLDIDSIVFAILLKGLFAILTFIAVLILSIFAILAGSVISVVLLPIYSVLYQKDINEVKKECAAIEC